MAETYINITSGGIHLEGFMEKGVIESAAAIICHPHPLYGGNMDNGVVTCLQHALRKFGWSTVRFNSRGVGRSQGRYDGGRGEAQDLLSVAVYLSTQGVRDIHLVGYSFGAWVALKSLELSLQPVSLVLVSPPIDLLDFGSLNIPPVPCLITTGDQDDFCDLSSLGAWAAEKELDASLTGIEVLPGCDHFYWGHEAVLSATILQFLKKHFRAADDE
jgi:uncharacterized protein